MSMSCVIESVRVIPPIWGLKKPRLRLPMNRWSYSTPTDQFCAKPTSNPVPMVPPQRAFAGLVKAEAGRDTSVFVVSDGRTALYIPEHVVPGITNLTGHQPDCIHLALI